MKCFEPCIANDSGDCCVDKCQGPILRLQSDMSECSEESRAKKYNMLKEAFAIAFSEAYVDADVTEELDR